MRPKHKKRFEIPSLVASFVIIAICEAFFVLDVVADMFGIDIAAPWIDHSIIELVSTATLAFALIAIGLQIQWLLREHKSAKESVRAASGELLTVIDDSFANWRLTRSEREIALLLIKGFSVQEIAELRQTRPGTVKSQSSALYQKAGMSGRNELVAYFVEDLLGTNDVDSQTP